MSRDKYRSFPENYLQIKLVNGNREFVNEHRRVIREVCRGLNITRKRFKKLMKNDKFVIEINKQLENINV